MISQPLDTPGTLRAFNRSHSCNSSIAARSFITTTIQHAASSTTLFSSLSVQSLAMTSLRVTLSLHFLPSWGLHRFNIGISVCFFVRSLPGFVRSFITSSLSHSLYNANLQLSSPSIPFLNLSTVFKY